jgi:hypothetical protein
MPGPTDWSDLLHEDFESIEIMLRTWYCKEGLGMESIASRLGINKEPVRKKLLSYGIPLHAKGKPGPNNYRVEKKQQPNKFKDTKEEMALKREGFKLGMRPDDYNPTITRLAENRDCPRWDSCLTYTSILHGWTIPCANCNGSPIFLESMERTLPVFEEQFFSLPEISYREPGCLKPEPKKNHQFHKFMEGIYIKGY